MGRGKETPSSLLKGGVGFFCAAKAICDESGCPKKDCLMAYYALTCQAIELSCKAVLLKKGANIGQLRGRFGHDISSLVSEASRSATSAHLDEKDKSIARMMSADYKSRNYHYRRSGYSYRLVAPPLPLDVASRFIEWARIEVC